MTITEIRISMRGEEKLKAFVSITLDDCFVVRGLKIIEGRKGPFVAMPSRRLPDGTFQDIAHPINRETREWMERLILGTYAREAEQDGRAGSRGRAEPRAVTPMRPAAAYGDETTAR